MTATEAAVATESPLAEYLATESPLAEFRPAGETSMIVLGGEIQ